MINTQIAKYRALDQWFRQDTGQAIAAEIYKLLKQLQPCLRGENIIQVGVPGQHGWLSCFDTESQWLVSPDQSSKQVDLICPVEQLSIETGSIDIIFAPLCLEAFSQPQSLLEEFDRVLKPMGCLVIVGINPYSFWSAAAHLGKLNCFGDYPPRIHSLMRVQHWLGRLGYQQLAHQDFWYLPPMKQKKWLKRFSIINEMGKMLWPFPAGFYLHVVKKYTEAYPTPERVKENLQFAKGLQPGW